VALTNNQNLAAAAARIVESRALVAEARSGLYPQATAGGTPGGDITRERTSVNQPLEGVASGTPHTFNTFTAPLYLGWEVDLWGRVRREAEGAHERYVASLDDLESAKLDLTAEVASDYFTLRALDDKYALITNTIETYQRSLDLTESRRRGGIVSDLDVAQAATQLHSAEAELPDIKLQRAQLLHAVAVLCGRSPVDFMIATGPSETARIPFVPPTVPSDLLEHRPDISEAERLMSAANADIGVAKAAFFPSVTINGLVGLQSIDAASLFNMSSRFWAVGPSIELPLFTGGLNRARLAAAHAAYDETVANYRQTVLNAFEEVEDQLSAQRLLADEWTGQYAALDSSRQALEIANNRYKSGLITYLDVVTAQTDTLDRESAVVDLDGARLVATVNLIKALGCGWQNAARPQPISQFNP
jgi:NodT family efflux transporter outer membrane factor (OMF) lipoprotein